MPGHSPQIKIKKGNCSGYTLVLWIVNLDIELIRLEKTKNMRVFLRHWNLARRAGNIFNVKLCKSTLFLVSVYQLNQYINSTITYIISIIISYIISYSFFCFLFT